MDDKAPDRKSDGHRAQPDQLLDLLASDDPANEPARTTTMEPTAHEQQTLTGGGGELERVGGQLSELYLREALDKVHWMMAMAKEEEPAGFVASIGDCDDEKEESSLEEAIQKEEKLLVMEGEENSDNNNEAELEMELAGEATSGGESEFKAELNPEEAREESEEEGPDRKVSLEEDYGQIFEHLAGGRKAAAMRSESHETAPLSVLSEDSPPSPASPSQSEFVESYSEEADQLSSSERDETLIEEEEEEEDFCGEMASSSTLRRIKMSTFEDVMVCEQNRQSLESARRLFDTLAKRQQQLQKQQVPIKNGRASAPLMRLNGGGESGKKGKKSNSLSSEEGANCQVDSNSSASSTTGFSNSSESDPYDTIKIIRRTLSSASSASNFRQTLVCSVSPTSQLNGSNSDLISQQHIQLGGESKELILEHQLYPMDGDEILQCRAAFRENKRLIQEQQERASRMELEMARNSTFSGNLQQQQNNSVVKQQHHYNSTGRLNGTTGSGGRYESSHNQTTCSHCKQRLYPVDQMDLDFTKTTLNIHRNCFKCHVCSSMLRLETYAAMDAKLYCPAHVKCVAPSR